MLEWIRQKKINHLYKKACKAMARFDNAICKDTKNLFLKELINRVYGKTYMKVLFNEDEKNYADTDSIIYSDFNKKQET